MPACKVLEFGSVIVIQRERVEPVGHLMEERIALQCGEGSEIDIGAIELHLSHFVHLLVHLLIVHPFGILSVLGEVIRVYIRLLRLFPPHHTFHQRRHDVVAHSGGHSVGGATHLQLHHGGIEVMHEGGIVAIDAQSVSQILTVLDAREKEVENKQEAHQCTLRHDVVFHQVAIQEEEHLRGVHELKKRQGDGGDEDRLVVDTDTVRENDAVGLLRVGALPHLARPCPVEQVQHGCFVLFLETVHAILADRIAQQFVSGNLVDFL